VSADVPSDCPRSGRGAVAATKVPANEPVPDPLRTNFRMRAYRGNRSRAFAGVLSPLTDSNRRPPPYHSALRREPRASAGSRDHESPARHGDRARKNDRAWTRVPALVFPQCSLSRLRGSCWDRGAPLRLDHRLVRVACPMFAWSRGAEWRFGADGFGGFRERLANPSSSRVRRSDCSRSADQERQVNADREFRQPRPRRQRRATNSVVAWRTHWRETTESVQLS